MNLTQIQYFVQIVECGFNLTLASQKIFVTQSALSQFIHNFEESENIKLFVRNKNRLEGLTEEGEKIYQHAIQVLEKYNQMIDVIKQETQVEKQTVRIGATSSYFRFYFPNFFRKFAAQHPHISIELVDDSIPNLYKKFSNGELDFALLVSPTKLPEGFATERELFQDQIVAFLLKDHPLAAQETVSWEQVASYPIITLSKDFCTYRKIAHHFKKEGLTHHILYTSPSWEYLIESINDDSAITLLPSVLPSYINKEKVVIKTFQNPASFNIRLVQLNSSANQPGVKIMRSALDEFLSESIRIS